MSPSSGTLWSSTRKTSDRFLKALLGAEELEKLGFALQKLRSDQIDTIGDEFHFSLQQRRRLREAIEPKQNPK